MNIGGDFQKAVDTNDAETVQEAIDDGHEVTRGAVTHAATNNYTNSLGVLLEHVDEISCDALHLAAQNGCREALEVLLEAGFDPDLGDSGGTTALFYAALKDRPEFIELLVDAGADVEHLDSQDRTALDIAIKYDNTAAAQALVDTGASMSDEQAGQLAKMGLDVDAEPAAADESRSDEVVGRWALAKVFYDGDMESAGFSPYTPQEQSAKEMRLEDNFIEFHEDGSMEGRYFYTNFEASWELDGDRITQNQKRREPKTYRLSEDGTRLKLQDYDEEHGLDMFVTFVSAE